MRLGADGHIKSLPHVHDLLVKLQQPSKGHSTNTSPLFTVDIILLPRTECLASETPIVSHCQPSRSAPRVAACSPCFVDGFTSTPPMFRPSASRRQRCHDIHFAHAQGGDRTPTGRGPCKGHPQAHGPRPFLPFRL
jgi:hypothetical protein